MPKDIAIEVIATRVLQLRDKKVMLGRDVAKLYGASAKVLNQAVKRNSRRFPDDFMFQLSWEEVKTLRSQFVTLKTTRLDDSKRGEHIKYLPYAFTEHGVAMLSSVLNSERAIQANILIMRAFAKLREILLNHKELAVKIEEMEKKYDKQFVIVYQAIKQLLEPLPPAKEEKIIGFRTYEEKKG